MSEQTRLIHPKDRLDGSSLARSPSCWASPTIERLVSIGAMRAAETRHLAARLDASSHSQALVTAVCDRSVFDTEQNGDPIERTVPTRVAP